MAAVNTLDFTPNGLYEDAKTGQLISTHSMLKTFRRCPKQAQYKYVERLKPRMLGRPLRLGTWMHKLQEVKYLGGDWKQEHARQTAKFKKLFDEEQDFIGNLPDDCNRLMESYLWHYKNDNWKILETEFILEAELPDGSRMRGRIDNLIEDQFGLWIVDHKWHRSFPDNSYRVLDQQSGGYLWLALKNKIPVQGHIWNYGRSKPPTMPTLTKTGLIGRWDSLDTDYITAAKFIKAHPDLKNKARYMAKLKRLQAMRYEFGKPQHSNFFKRIVVEKSPQAINQAIRELYHTHKRMHDYPFEKVDQVERVPDFSCKFSCSYRELCAAEATTGERPVNFKKLYTVGDPMDYYNDDRKEEEGIH